MRAMVLAAGLGTRLRPLTEYRPKALVEIDGRSLLEITLSRLRSFGIEEVIVNVHHFADQVIAHLEARGNFGMRVEVSQEDVLLDTGGGLKKASHFFLRHNSDEPFLVHNVDVLSAVDLNRLMESHRERGALATLAVQERNTSRPLLFDDELELCGRSFPGGEIEIVRPAPVRPLAFCGIHVVSPRIFSRMSEQGVFPIVPAYLRLAGEGERVLGFRADEYYWRDLGRQEDLEQAASDLKSKLVS